MPAETNPQPPGEDSIALRTALWLHGRGLWPVLIYPRGAVILTRDGPREATGKEPLGGEGWGRVRKTPEQLRALAAAHPGCGVGLKLGKDGGLIDIENDAGEAGEALILEMLGGEDLETLSCFSRRGRHRFFAWDDRLAAHGRQIIKVPAGSGQVEIRIGTLSLDAPAQIQSVVPPTPNVDGTPREWTPCEIVAPLPEAFFGWLERALTPPRTAPDPSTIPIYTPPPGSRWTAEERARAYLAKCDSAISGQHGHDRALWAACVVGPGFDLPEDVAFRLLWEDFNPRCQPPWSEREVRHKVEDAYKRETRRGWLLNAERNEESGKKGNAGKVSNGNFVNNVNFADGSKENETSEWEPIRWRQPLEAIPFPLEVLPDSLATLCREGAASFQCPADFFAVSALTLAGGVIGRSVNLILKGDYQEQPNLYLAVVCLAGTRKSPVIRALAGPLKEIAYDLDRKYREEKAVYEQRRQEWEASSRKSDRGLAPEPPIRLKLTIDDATREAVAKIHSENPRGLVLIKDELAGWVAALNAYRQGKGDDRQFWMSVNSGAGVEVDRKGSNRESFVISRPCIAILGPLTPSSLPSVRGGQEGDGWLDRLLFSYPDSILPAGWTEDEIAEDLLRDWSEAIRKLWARPMLLDDKGRSQPNYIRLTPAAKISWKQWVDSHRAERRDPDFPRSMQGPWSKLEGFTARFALILSQIHQAYDPTDQGPPRNVEPGDIRGARKLADYFKIHFQRAWTEIYRRPDEISDETQAILRWILRHKKTFFSWRDITRQFPRYDDADRHASINWMMDRHMIRERSQEPRAPGRRGRTPGTTFDVHPELLCTVSKIDTIDENRCPTDVGDAWEGNSVNSVNFADGSKERQGESGAQDEAEANPRF